MWSSIFGRPLYRNLSVSIEGAEQRKSARSRTPCYGLVYKRPDQKHFSRSSKRYKGGNPDPWHIRLYFKTHAALLNEKRCFPKTTRPNLAQKLRHFWKSTFSVEIVYTWSLSRLLKAQCPVCSQQLLTTEQPDRCDHATLVVCKRASQMRESAAHV